MRLVAYVAALSIIVPVCRPEAVAVPSVVLNPNQWSLNRMRNNFDRVRTRSIAAFKQQRL